MSSNHEMEKKKMGGFLGIPNMGIKNSIDKFRNKQPEDSSEFKPVVPTPENTPPNTPSVSPSPNDQKMLDDNRKKCIASADEKIKQATEEKKQCDSKFPRKKFLGLFGGKKRSRKNKNMKRTKKMKRTNKRRKTASK